MDCALDSDTRHKTFPIFNTDIFAVTPQTRHTLKCDFCDEQRHRVVTGASLELNVNERKRDLGQFVFCCSSGDRR